MGNYKYQEIPISNLVLDLNNPRHDKLDDQQAVIAELLTIQGDKIFRLIKDIVAEGTNPADLPIVVPESKKSKKYVVVEGNRRIIALRLLVNPNLATPFLKPFQKRKLQELSSQQGSNSSTSLQCVVFQNREDATHWIELRHTGQNDGVGIVDWDAASVARFKKGQSWMALQVVDFVKNELPPDGELRKQVDRISLTNVARLVNDPDVRAALGIRPENGKLSSDVSDEGVRKTLTKVVTDIATREIKVDDIKKKSHRLKYVENLVLGGYAPPAVKKKVERWYLPAVPVKGKAKRGRPPSISRKALIPSACVLRIKHPRINEMHYELKSIDVDQFQNCAAVMLRVFLELSLDEFGATNKLSFKSRSGGNRRPTLSDKILDVADCLENTKTLNRSQLMSMRAAAKKKNDLFSADMWHAYVHNRHHTPKASELKTTWDNMQSFMEAVWP